MPAEQVLPDDIKELAFRNGFELAMRGGIPTFGKWRSDWGWAAPILLLRLRRRKAPPSKARLAGRRRFPLTRRPGAMPSGGAPSLADPAKSARRFRGCRRRSGLRNIRALHSAMDVEAREAGVEDGQLQFRDRGRKGRADADRQRKRFISTETLGSGVGMDMVLIPAGVFTMGSPIYEPGTSFQRGPATLSRSPFILYQRVAGNAVPVGGSGRAAPQ